MNDSKKIIKVTCSKCKEEQKIQKRSYEMNIYNNQGKYICKECLYKKNSNFRRSLDGSYWIGTTICGKEFLFDGDSQLVKQITSRIWHINQQGFIIDKNNNRLNRIVMKMTTQKKLRYINGDKYDNRLKNLELVAEEFVMENCSKCGMKCSLGRRAYKDNIRRNQGKYICQSCTHRKENEFIESVDRTYWIGKTNKGKEFFFSGDEEIVEYIKSCTWGVGNDGYIINSNNERLHKIIMRANNGCSIVINHINGNICDNRRNNLEVSTHVDNAKQRVAGQKSKTKIVGLRKRGKKYSAQVTISTTGIQVTMPVKNQEDALIELLVIQQYYGYRHNQHLYYLLEDIPQEKKQNILKEVEEKINKSLVKVNSTNKFYISQDKNFYDVSDGNDMRFKVSKTDVEIVKKGSWRVRTKSSGKQYVIGEVVEAGKKKTVQLHRYLLGIAGEKEYYDWYVDHKNGDSLDNRRENLVITDSMGNALNRPTKGYKRMTGGRYLIDIDLLGINFKQSVATEEEAVQLVKTKREEVMKQRLEFKNIYELKGYVETIITMEGIS
nr:hypothetical protein [uncultured Niameybacter sp.]